MKPRLLDLFCCAGGATRGYQKAGFEVVGCDIDEQPNYIGDDFILGDALEVMECFVAGVGVTAYSGRIYHLSDFDAIHASPPCQHWSKFTPKSHRKNHAALIAPTREQFQRAGKPYIIENLESAWRELRSPVMLCGSMVNLPIERHRYFECVPQLITAVIAQNDRLYCRHISNPVLITDHGGPNANGWGKPRQRTPLAFKRVASGISWMTEDEITESIPPAYTEYLGKRLMAYVMANAEATP